MVLLISVGAGLLVLSEAEGCARPRLDVPVVFKPKGWHGSRPLRFEYRELFYGLAVLVFVGAGLRARPLMIFVVFNPRAGMEAGPYEDIGVLNLCRGGLPCPPFDDFRGF